MALNDLNSSGLKALEDINKATTSTANNGKRCTGNIEAETAVTSEMESNSVKKIGYKASKAIIPPRSETKTGELSSSDGNDIVATIHSNLRRFITQKEQMEHTENAAVPSTEASSQASADQSPAPTAATTPSPARPALAVPHHKHRVDENGVIYNRRGQNMGKYQRKRKPTPKNNTEIVNLVSSEDDSAAAANAAATTAAVTNTPATTPATAVTTAAATAGAAMADGNKHAREDDNNADNGAAGEQDAPPDPAHKKIKLSDLVSLGRSGYVRPNRDNPFAVKKKMSLTPVDPNKGKKRIATKSVAALVPALAQPADAEPGNTAARATYGIPANPMGKNIPGLENACEKASAIREYRDSMVGVDAKDMSTDHATQLYNATMAMHLAKKPRAETMIVPARMLSSVIAHDADTRRASYYIDGTKEGIMKGVAKKDVAKMNDGTEEDEAEMDDAEKEICTLAGASKKRSKKGRKPTPLEKKFGQGSSRR